MNFHAHNLVSLYLRAVPWYVQIVFVIYKLAMLFETRCFSAVFISCKGGHFLTPGISFWIGFSFFKIFTLHFYMSCNSKHNREVKFQYYSLQLHHPNFCHSKPTNWVPNLYQNVSMITFLSLGHENFVITFHLLWMMEYY